MAVREAKVEAQAKLNLFLRVLAREDNGYHQIETLFCRVALADTVTVGLTTSGRTLECHGERMPAGGLGPMEKNLAWRAATAYADATGFPSGFEIDIEKRIPVGGGLGGGSADAGAVLRALNALNPQPVNPGALLGIATTLGADVPFLTQDAATAALAWGRGDRMALLSSLPASTTWLLVPDVSVNTAEAYRWVDAVPRATGALGVSFDQLGSWAGVASLAVNDFEAVVAARVPIVGRLLANLRDESLRSLLGPSSMVVMTGSGSCVAVLAGERAPTGLSGLAAPEGVVVVETETSEFVEPVVLTH